MKWLVAMAAVCLGAATVDAGGLPPEADALPGVAATLPSNPEVMPQPPRGERSFRAVVMSDFNGPYGSTTYRAEVHALVRLVVEVLRPELVISAGDLVAGQRRGLTDEQLEAMWAGFHDAVVRPLREAGIPFLPAAGNHDASGYPAFASEREKYARVWQREGFRPAVQPVEVAGHAYPLAYGVVFKAVGVVVLDVTTVERLAEGKLDWVETMVGRLREAGASDIVASSHVPPYPVTVGRERETIAAPDDDRMVELLARLRVRVWFTGHHHGYFKGRRPGAWGGLHLVSVNACGDGPRRLIGTETPQPQSLVVMDVEDGRIARVFAVQWDGKIVSDRELPVRLAAEGQELLRWDVEGAAEAP